MKKKKEYRIWCCLCGKRQIKRRSFLAALLLLPVIAWCFHYFEKQDDGKIAVAVYAEEEEECTRWFMEELKKQKGMDFYQVSALEDLEKDVNSMEADCGLVISADLEEKLKQGDYVKILTLYASPATTNVAVTREVVYAEFARCFDSFWSSEEIGGILKEHGSKVDSREEMIQEIAENNQILRQNYQGFHFTYETIEGEKLVESPEKRTKLFPVKGIIGIYLMVIALFAINDVIQDKRHKLYRVFDQKGKWLASWIQIAIPVYGSGLSGWISLWIAHEEGNLLKEGLSLALYCFLLCCIMCLAGNWIKKEQALAVMIPFAVIGSLVFCPIFLDIQKLLPAFQGFGYLFLPYYYLLL